MELRRLLSLEDVTLLGNWQCHMLRPQEEAARAQRLSGVRPHLDPVLRDDPVAYAGFVRELLERGLVQLLDAKQALGHAGVFFVKKKWYAEVDHRRAAVQRLFS